MEKLLGSPIRHLLTLFLLFDLLYLDLHIELHHVKLLFLNHKLKEQHAFCFFVFQSSPRKSSTAACLTSSNFFTSALAFFSARSPLDFWAAASVIFRILARRSSASTKDYHRCWRCLGWKSGLLRDCLCLRTLGLAGGALQPLDRISALCYGLLVIGVFAVFGGKEFGLLREARWVLSGALSEHVSSDALTKKWTSLIFP